MNTKKLDRDELYSIIGKHSMLFKFGKKEYMQKFQEGEVYMNRIQYYIDLAKEKNDEFIGDEFEATIPLNNVTMQMLEPDTGNLLGEAKGNLNLTYGDIKKYPIYCLFSLNFNNVIDNILYVDDNRLEVRYEFTSEQMEQIKKYFGDTVVAITDPDKFIEKILNYSKSNNICCMNGGVKYYSNNQKEHLVDCKENPDNIAFWKREKYKEQQEYRIMLCQENEKEKIIDIGNIKDITKLLSTEEILNTYAIFTYQLKEEECLS